ncbi:redoxin domain-containing protein [Halorubrum sp. CSM-61]|uniref:redoxin domain-containing protein n=1 Tax=Halorubrum sp. CSM-61 TaxID=2485838 RepID=UPI000F4C8D9F|nr:redoxin domain-containing protein [Halorubrum sp. CSM-61]
MPDFDVVSLPETDHVDEGDTAPDFARPLVDEEYWEDRALDEVVDGPTLLLFHPMDGAFQATYLYNTVDDHGWAEDLDVLALSISTPYAHKRLLSERGDGIRAFSDPGADVVEEYGLAHDVDGMTGITETRPAVFLLDSDRTVEFAWVASEHPEFPDAEAIDGAVERLVD